MLVPQCMGRSGVALLPPWVGTKGAGRKWKGRLVAVANHAVGKLVYCCSTCSTKKHFNWILICNTKEILLEEKGISNLPDAPNKPPYQFRFLPVTDTKALDQGYL